MDFADLPDGSTQWLIRIDHWDFNWQGDYRFTEPAFSPERVPSSASTSHTTTQPRTRKTLTNRQSASVMASTRPMKWANSGSKSSQLSHDDSETLNRDYGRHCCSSDSRNLQRRLATDTADAALQIEIGKTLPPWGGEPRPCHISTAPSNSVSRMPPSPII